MDFIDVHHHAVPPFYFSAAATALHAQTQGHAPPTVRTWTPAQSLEAMQQEGIATSVLSISTPGVWFGDTAAAVTLARQCNDYMAEVARANPGRFGVFAAVPLPDIDGTLAEIAYALDELKADGIGFLSSYGDRWLGDPAFVPVLEELNRRKTVVYVHPTAPACCSNIQPGIVAPMLEFVFDTTRTIASLLFAGALLRFPEIQFIFSHSGGTLPMLSGRIAAIAMRTCPDYATLVPDGFEDAIARLYFDVATSMYPASYASLRAVMPLSQILLGTDYPFQPIPGTTKGFNSLVTSAGERSAITRDNALRLFPQFA